MIVHEKAKPMYPRLNGSFVKGHAARAPGGGAEKVHHKPVSLVASQASGKVPNAY